MNNQQFIESISEKTHLKTIETKKIAVKLINIIIENVKKGETIKVSDFGNITRYYSKAKRVPDIHNPSSTIVVPAQNTIKYYPTIKFRDELNAMSPKNIVAKSVTEKEIIKKGLDGSAEKPSDSFQVEYIPYVDVSKITVPKEILNLIPEQLARKFQMVPIDKKGNVLKIAMIDPEDHEALELAKKETGLLVEPSICTKSDIGNVLNQYTAMASELNQIIKEGGEIKAKKEKKNTLPKSEEIAEDAPAAKIVSSLIKRGVRENASDIHIEPEEDKVIVRLRTDGILKKTIELPKEIQNAVVSRIKILADLKIDETRLPQDGRFTALIDQGDVDFRVSVMPVVNGEKVVMRILDKSKGLLTLEELGLVGNSYKIFEESITKSYGMILVTGPTGSGKTTTLYAVIKKIMSDKINIVTLEDPVEYQIRGINQTQVKPDIKFTFANGLRSIVRQDPDVIMIGEIRDYETADMAIHSALTGHVVLSTLHTNSASGAIPRLLDMKIEPFLISSTVNVIIAQRLARKICDKCKEKESIDTSELDYIKKIIGDRKEFTGKKLEFYKGKGCKDCNGSGYQGRVGIFEILPISNGIKSVISEKASTETIQETAKKEGMVTLMQDGILKAIEGLTTLEEVWRVTKD